MLLLISVPGLWIHLLWIASLILFAFWLVGFVVSRNHRSAAGIAGSQPPDEGVVVVTTRIPPLQVSFVGGERGDWGVTSITPIVGEGMKDVPRVHVVEGPWPFGLGGTWMVRGVVSNDRYIQRHERDALVAHSPALGRPEATRAALIPITKSPAWWALAQDERRAILEERSHHIATGSEYLPGIARRLHHGHDTGEEFDFLTWFEYSPRHTDAFNELVTRLRSTEEWRYVEREVDIRLARPEPPV